MATKKIIDSVRDIEAWLRRHPTATWTRPETAAGEHVVTWIQASADPSLDGQPQVQRNRDLGVIVRYLEALERSTMGVTAR